MRLLVHLPSRGRAKRGMSAAMRHIETLSRLHQVELLLSLDADDPELGDYMLKMPALRLAARRRGAHVRVAIGPSPGTKIGAVNRDMPTMTEANAYDIIVESSDDMRIVCAGWDEIVSAALVAAYPALDGALWCHDGYQDRLMTWPVVGRLFYKRLLAVQGGSWKSAGGSDSGGGGGQPRGVWDRRYITECADDQVHMLAERWCRLAKMTEHGTVVRHEHPAWGASEVDELYKRNLASDDCRYDRIVWAELRQEMQQQQADWMIGVLSVPERRDVLARLLADLECQINAIPGGWRRIALDCRIADAVVRGGPSVGSRRQAVLERAAGPGGARFVSFIDDDDWLLPGGVQRVLNAIDSDQSADAVEFDVALHDAKQRYGVSSGIGGGWQGWRLYKHGHKRSVIRFLPENGNIGGWGPINHLNPVRSELALLAGFDSARNYGEDFDYAARVQGLVQRTVRVAPDGTESGGPVYAYAYSDEQSLTVPLRQPTIPTQTTDTEKGSVPDAQ